MSTKTTGTTTAVRKTSSFRTVVLGDRGETIGEVRRLSSGTWHGRYINLYGADLALPHLPGDSEDAAIERVLNAVTYDEPGLYEIEGIESY